MRDLWMLVCIKKYCANNGWHRKKVSNLWPQRPLMGNFNGHRPPTSHTAWLRFHWAQLNFRFSAWQIWAWHCFCCSCFCCLSFYYLFTMTTTVCGCGSAVFIVVVVVAVVVLFFLPRPRRQKFDPFLCATKQ